MSRNNHHEIWSVTVIEITTVKEKKKSLLHWDGQRKRSERTCAVEHELHPPYPERKCSLKH